ncbi:MAG TPA: cytochrome c oxidase assembly protein [Stellaceae bacterium]|nr:cytochrome c oxidase assembly protein [Stellaceae bacterium]
MAGPNPRRHNGVTALALAGVVAGMVGLSFASVPLYRMFCAATGFGGTTQRAANAPKEVADAVITVRFNAEIAPDLQWEFRPVTPELRVHPGDQREVFFRAVNQSAETLTGSAIDNVTPTKVGIYFDKLQCFCFTKQRLLPGESRDLGVTFFVDPGVLDDPNTREVRTITLSYTMYRAPESGAPAASANPPEPAPARARVVN